MPNLNFVEIPNKQVAIYLNDSLIRHNSQCVDLELLHLLNIPYDYSVVSEAVFEIMMNNQIPHTFSQFENDVLNGTYE